MKNTSKNTSDAQKEVNALYKHFREVKGLLRTLGCDSVTAEDIFQEALIIYLRRKEDPNFTFDLEPIHYIKKTCKFLWYSAARKEQKQGTSPLERDVEEIHDPWMEKELQHKQLESALGKIGEQCRELLHLFYGLGWNMSDIAVKLGLRSDKVAKAQKYRCIQKAKELVQEARLSVEPIQF